VIRAVGTVAGGVGVCATEAPAPNSYTEAIISILVGKLDKSLKYLIGNIP
jgi:hypothetical protein